MRRTAAIELRAQVWDKSGGICHYCGEAMHPIRDFTVDHVLPRVRGGTDDLGNLVGACLACNLDKRERVPAGVGAVEREASCADATLTTAQVAARVGTNVEAVRSWLRAGDLTGFVVGSRGGWRVCPRDLDEFLARRANRPSSSGDG